jgi:hypothetical protein
LDDEETAERAKSNPAWARRTKRELEEWKKNRHILAAALLRKRAARQMEEGGVCCTVGCGNFQTVRCAECLEGQPMCSACDERLHPHAHFHHRSYLVDGHFWKSIGPDFVVRNGRLERVVKVLATPPSACCNQCSKANWGPAMAINKPLTIVTLAGRFDFFRAVFKCQTEHCGGAHEQGALDCVDLGAWPGTVSDCRTMSFMAVSGKLTVCLVGSVLCSLALSHLLGKRLSFSAETCAPSTASDQNICEDLIQREEASEGKLVIEVSD